MKAIKPIAILACIAALAGIAMLWQHARRSHAESEMLSVTGSAGQPIVTKTPTLPSKPSKVAPPPVETRFAISFSPRNGNDSFGSITIAQAGEGYNLISCERPGDSMMMSLGGMFGGGGGGMQTMIATGEGSEIRFSGRHDLGDGELTVAKGSRVCLKKSKGEWAYVCGLGQYIIDGKTNQLGSSRTVDSCLTLLAKDDDILREGAARELGWLTKPADAPRVVPKLVALLKDASQPLRRGAAEGLGLIGNQDAFAALKEALPTESDELTKKFIEEGLSLCGGLALTGDPHAAKVSDEEAAELFLGKTDSEKSQKSSKADWKTEMLSVRITSRQEDAFKSLTQKATSPSAKVSLAASVLREALAKTQ